MRFRAFYIPLAEAVTLADIPKKKGSKPATFFYGRLQPPTAAHVSVLKQMVQEFPDATPFVYVVRGAKSSQDRDKNPLTFETQKAILDKSLGALASKVQVRTIESGFFGEAIKDLREQDYEPVAFFCGTDRTGGYKQQLAYVKDIGVNTELREIKRTSEDVSASKVRAAVRGNDFATFKKMTVGLDKSDFERLKKEMA